MASKTFAAWLSKCSMVSSSISMLERIASGSPPSTSDCRPFFRNSSFSCSTADSSPSRPCLRAMLLHSTIFSIIAAGLFAGGLNTQATIFQARRKVAIGVCTRLAAKVPTTTITNAALPTSAPALLPFKMAPPMMAISAEHDPDDAQDVHDVQPGVSHSASRARRRTSACPWIWQTRDSETSRTSPISRRFMSSS